MLRAKTLEGRRAWSGGTYAQRSSQQTARHQQLPRVQQTGPTEQLFMCCTVNSLGKSSELRALAQGHLPTTGLTLQAVLTLTAGNSPHQTGWKTTRVSSQCARCPPSRPPWGSDSGLSPERLQPYFGQQNRYGSGTGLQDPPEIPRNDFFLNYWILEKWIPKTMILSTLEES